MIAISPRYDTKKLQGATIDDKIDVFEDQMIGWLIEPAKLMAECQHSGFAVLTLDLSYFEPIGQFLAGTSGRSSTRFKEGLIAVYPNVDTVEDHIFGLLYDQLRCGMFHRGITKDKVLVSRDKGAAIVINLGPSGSVAVHVNPWRVLSDIERHLRAYCKALRKPSDSNRKNFERWFDVRGA